MEPGLQQGRRPMSKLVSEAERLLEKGKVPEALDKLKSALKAEPLNQLVATKIANIYVDSGETVNAVKVLVALADRLSEAGKAQVAIAIYKQAIELNPQDIDLKIKFAQECEIVGKLGDAQAQANIALQHFLRRKKYFDASNIMPLLVRIQSKDERLKAAWIDIMQFSQADQKLLHLVVALCGPPGLVSQEFPVGGDPELLSEALYESLKKLVPFFPRDPKVAYAVAWTAHRRGKKRDFYHYLRECLRREPDFCLGILLYARVLAETQKLNEALFVYKHLKERMPADKSVDMLTLNKLVESFVEKNGWISFTEGVGVEELDAKAFKEALTGVAPAAGSGAEVAPAEAVAVPPPAAAAAGAMPPPPTPKKAAPPVISSQQEMPPAEIELSLGDASEAEAEALEVQFTGGQSKVVPAGISAAKGEAPPAPPAPASATPPLADDEVEFTSLIQTPSAEAASVTVAPAPAPVSAVPAPAEEAAPVEAAAPVVEAVVSKPKMTFNPLLPTDAPPITTAAPQIEGEKTQIFSPMEVLNASAILPNEIPDVATKMITRESAPAPPPAAPAEGPLPSHFEEVRALPAEGAGTSLFSPVETVEAGAASRKPIDLSEKAPPAADAEATTIMPGSGASEELDQATMLIRAADFAPSETVAQEPVIEELAGELGGAFVKIPEAAPVTDETSPAEAGEKIDLGDDLLEGPTKFLTVKPKEEATEHLLEEIKKDLGEKKQTLVSDAAYMLKRSERYIAKRNYYMARKSLRHAQALGADEAQVKARLGEIRKLEMPDGLYHSTSSDESEKVASSEILDRLEEEFDLRDSEESESNFGLAIEGQLENIFRETDPRTVLDFGVALHEMGLFRQAEEVFSRMVDEFPETAFDAYYLAAVAKFARKDYAGAASILKKLSNEAGKSEQDKIQIYYTLGELFEKMRRPENSKEFFRKVAELDANYRNIRHKLEE